MRRMGGKVVILTRGGLEICQWTRDLVRNPEGFPEVSRGHSSPAKGGDEGPNMWSVVRLGGS